MALLTPEQTLSQLKMMEERWASMRSHPRATASLRLRLEWDEGEARRTANGLTVDVSHSGCMAVVGADVPLHRDAGRWAEPAVFVSPTRRLGQWPGELFRRARAQRHVPS